MNLSLNALNRFVRRTTVTAACLVAVGVSGVSMANDAVEGSIEAGREKISMCIGCHAIPGYKTAFPEVYSVPMIAGQNEQYLIIALRAYATGERSHPSMNAISGSLTEQDMADLAAYYANLK